MKIAVQLLALVVLVSVSVCHACSCLSSTVPKQYYNPSHSRVVRAVVKRERREPCPKGQFNCKVFYSISVTRSFKGCFQPSNVLVSTSDNSAACGVTLSVGTEYLFYLTSDKVPSINLCQFIQRFSDLSAADLEFLESRFVCCEGSCSCSRLNPVVNCFVAPCSVAEKPCEQAVSCRDNYCGGCRAEWFTEDGYPACSREESQLKI